MKLNSLGRRIQVLRESNMMTKGDLAQQIGVTRKEIVDWEEGNAVPTAEQVIEIAKFFSADPRSLLDVADEEEKEEQPAAVPAAKEGKRFALGLLVLALGLCVMLGGLYLMQTLTGGESIPASSSAQVEQSVALPESLPLAAVPTACWDLDGDGEKEVVATQGGEVLFFQKEGSGYTAYTLAQPLEKGWTLTAQDGVFVLKNAAGESRIYSVLRQGALYPAG